MDSSRKWNSTITSNTSEFAYSQVSARDSHHRVPQIPQKAVDENNQKLKILSEGANETLAENTELTRELLQFLSPLDHQPQTLSRQVTQGLDQISAILRRENINRVDEVALTVAVDSRRRRELFAAREERELKRKYEQLCCKYAKIQEKLYVVQEAVNKINDLVVSNRQDYENTFAEMVHKMSKLSDYEKHCHALDQELSEMQVTLDYPERLLDKYNQYLQSKGELVQLDKTLKKYGELPPDILPAKAVLQQTERHRQNVKNLLDKKMSSI